MFSFNKIMLARELAEANTHPEKWEVRAASQRKKMQQLSKRESLAIWKLDYTL